MTFGRDLPILHAHDMALDIAALLTEIAAGEDTRIEFKEIVFQGANWRDTDGWDAQMPIAQRALESEDR